MTQRIATVDRKTNETHVKLTINLDGAGRADVHTGVGFFDHMLDLLARHGLFDLDVKAVGDLHVDAHHTVEDVGIVLGQAIEKAVGDKQGISRYGWAIVPMDDSLAQAAVDLGGRPTYVSNVKYPAPTIGDFPVELVDEFWKSVAFNARLNLHVTVPYGDNNHHIAEAIFKSIARSLRAAVAVDPRQTGPATTKGVI